MPLRRRYRLKEDGGAICLATLNGASLGAHSAQRIGATYENPTARKRLEATSATNSDDEFHGDVIEGCCR
jgi:hypothetical protein